MTGRLIAASPGSSLALPFLDPFAFALAPAYIGGYSRGKYEVERS